MRDTVLQKIADAPAIICFLQYGDTVLQKIADAPAISKTKWRHAQKVIHCRVCSVPNHKPTKMHETSWKSMGLVSPFSTKNRWPCGRPWPWGKPVWRAMAVYSHGFGGRLRGQPWPWDILHHVCATILIPIFWVPSKTCVSRIPAHTQCGPKHVQAHHGVVRSDSDP